MSDPFEKIILAGKSALSESQHPSNTTRLEVGFQNFFPWATPVVVLRILGGLEGALKDPTYLKPQNVTALNQIIARAVYQQQSAIQEYLDPVWEAIGSLPSIQEREAKVQHAIDALKLKIHGITDSMSQEAILYIKSLDAGEHLAATEYWEQMTKRLSLFLEKSMKITLKRFDKALDAAEEIWRQREEAGDEIEEELDLLLERLDDEGAE
ncbi:uncharacterized protein LAJ45_02986 [Morchella importuna]|uniref:uncharacterized protein n=1 Tax=Morchella importuna TaxID=1174673 RepID=UPI001E8EB313|nr:uncharacterized protein LAJ45_02986 [Morchella importuna]KAH8152761.1 hypothetical protein LAJ45_02986 [Morchella importuna]